jgi:flavin-dependent dehydrogenase
MTLSFTDVLVIGGGPAGLASAIAARRKGFNVVLADPGGAPHDKACGEGFMPDGIAAARALGIDLEDLESRAFRGIRFCAANRSVAGDFPHGAGLGIRRTVLHRALAQRAERLGIDLLWGTRVQGIRDDEAIVAGRRLRARFIVGADGGRSRVREWSGLERAIRNTRRFGFRRHFGVAPWSRYMELHWSRDAQLYLTPVSEREVCAALVSRDPHLRMDRALRLFPQAAERLRGASVNDAEQGGVTASRRLRAVTSGCVALVGDASGSVDAITGQGLSLSFQQAASLADAMAAGDLARYQDTHDRLMRRARIMAGLMLSLDGRAWLQRFALEAMTLWPRSFETLLAFHVGALANSPD